MVCVLHDTVVMIDHMSDATYYDTIRKLARYEVWCNAQIIGAADKLAADQLFQTFPFGFKTIHATLFHTVEVFQLWSGCVGPVIEKPELAPYDPGMSMEALAEWNAKLSQSFLRSVDASNAMGVLGEERRLTQLFHLVTHGTHHRTQAITMLRMLGIDPPYEPGDFAGWSRAE